MLLSVFFMGMDKTRKCGVDGAEWVQGGGAGYRVIAGVLGLKCPQGMCHMHLEIMLGGVASKALSMFGFQSFPKKYCQDKN